MGKKYFEGWKHLTVVILISICCSSVSGKYSIFEMGDEMETIELNILSSEKLYKFNLMNTNNSLFCQKLSKSRLTNDDDDSSSEEENEEPLKKCSTRLSFSLVKMNCDNETGNYLKIRRVSQSGHEFRNDILCQNYNYDYAGIDEPKHNLDDFEATGEIIIEPVGSWGVQLTTASIIVSVHYEFQNETCPYGYFDCNRQSCKNRVEKNEDDHKKTVICIPTYWLCDKRPNCAICSDDADEAQDICYWNGQYPVEDNWAFNFQNVIMYILDAVFFVVIPMILVGLFIRYLIRHGCCRKENVPRTSRTSDPEVRVESTPSRTRGDQNFNYNLGRRKSSMESPPPTYGEVIGGSYNN